jgi:hypothetical protein
MKKEQGLLHLHEMTTSELLSASGGGEADDLCYNFVYFALATSPIYWTVRYSGWVVEKLFG